MNTSKKIVAVRLKRSYFKNPFRRIYALNPFKRKDNKTDVAAKAVLSGLDYLFRGEESGVFKTFAEEEVFIDKLNGFLDHEMDWDVEWGEDTTTFLGMIKSMNDSLDEM